MPLRWQVLAAAAVLLAGCGSADVPPTDTPHSPTAGAAPSASETAHFAFLSTADRGLTTRAAVATEALFDAYVGFFGDVPAAVPAKFKLRIYATRDEFQANNRSRPWAEAFYHQGVGHAYLDDSRPNPFHWLLHETVHQLNRELTGYAKEKWINEGLATYLASSRFAEGRLQPGVMDLDAYPLGWLRRWPLSGDWDADVRAGKVISLRALITGQGGPPLDASVNAHYLGYWSLSHFLMHHDGGRHAGAYRQMLRQGASLADFERLVGPLEEIEPQWYAYLLEKTRTVSTSAGAGSPIMR